MLPHQTQIKICPYISLGINSHSQIAPVKIKAKKTHPSRPRHMGNAFLSTVPGRPPLCTPKTSAWPPPTCPAAARDWLSCSPSRECRGVGLPVGTRGLPRLGGRDLQPRGSRFQRWGVETWEEPQLRPHGSWNGKKSQQRPHWTSGEKILFQAIKHCGCSHCWPALTKQPWGDHGGGYGSDDLPSQTLSNAFQNNQRINIAKGLDKPCRACRQVSI